MDFKQQVIAALEPTVSEFLSKEALMNVIEVPKSSDLGDYAFPTFQLAKSLHKAPQQIALDLVAKIDQTAFEKVVATGPYVNFFLNKQTFSEETLKTILKADQNYGDQDLGHGGNVPIDMSSPNIAKPISMGHLRSTVIGNAIAKILTKTGYHPIKINHLGDWGTQFGKLIVAYKKWGSEAAVREDPITNLLNYYVRFHKEDVAHPELDDEARAWFKKLEDGDQEATDLWQWFRSESLKEFQKIYQMLGVEFDSFNGEAFYNDKMAEVIDLLKAKNLLHESQGAEIVDLEKYGLNPALIQKSDGATLYMTRDLAAAIYRKRTYHFVQSLYVVGNEQSEHFQQLKAVLKEMGYNWADQIVHIPFGLITENGKKLSTRQGRVILLEEVLNDAIRLAKAQIKEKNPDLPNQDKVAKEVGVGAVIFHDLKNDRMDNFDFNLEEVVRFEGETGPYVQYTNARAQSILRKSSLSYTLDDALALTDDAAWDILKLLADYPEVIQRALKLYEPSVIAKYSLRLAKQFNKYYAHTRILVDDPQLNARLSLVKSVTIVLENALSLLGVASPQEM
ncbi:arginine--tRNA ligase [Agrilactobacillus fermenti]|uniref:arginine--tRNA ligase n=1 Tax=Agrilactobacillus fermenti TaxID=2586909 RepID=UPI001E2EC054|nr:arginine--tRNA ligase [Agrilactobacillus fermenti]MCD2257464.1 arginine--tRNA ligase [Agrilactobacillus fermenti]